MSGGSGAKWNCGLGFWGFEVSGHWFGMPLWGLVSVSALCATPNRAGLGSGQPQGLGVAQNADL